MDYHNCALGVVYGTGMHRADNLKPIFWRTPGYPFLLGTFYKYYGVNSSHFDKNHAAQKLFLWLQIIICSCTPPLLLYLAYSLTSSLTIAYITAFISSFHPGFILSSMYLLTEGIALLFFYFFILFFYQSFFAYGQEQKKNKKWQYAIIGAAFTLALYTWMRPMGEFVSIIALILLMLASQEIWYLKIKKTLLFGLIFFSCLMPWYVRNYKLTGHWFFCPMSGAYLNTFTAPKIIRTTHNFPLEKSIGICYYLATQAAEKEEINAQKNGYKVSKEYIAGRIAWPILYAHPFLALKEWVQEVCKTTFDLYSCQITALCTQTFMYDPLEEFLPTKISESLWREPIPYYARLIAWIEFFFMIFLWIGLCAGFWQFMVKPLYHYHTGYQLNPINGLWLKVAPLIWTVLCMTGGFGYARLRLPIEPLMIILSLTWWTHKNIDHKNKKT